MHSWIAEILFSQLIFILCSDCNTGGYPGGGFGSGYGGGYGGGVMKNSGYTQRATGPYGGIILYSFNLIIAFT